jgi:hypothetical protein
MAKNYLVLEQRATSGVASFDNKSFDTNSFSPVAWFFDAIAQPDATELSLTGEGMPDFAIDYEQLHREDDDIIAVIMAGIKSGII